MLTTEFKLQTEDTDKCLEQVIHIIRRLVVQGTKRYKFKMLEMNRKTLEYLAEHFPDTVKLTQHCDALVNNTFKIKVNESIQDSKIIRVMADVKPVLDECFSGGMYTYPAYVPASFNQIWN